MSVTPVVLMSRSIDLLWSGAGGFVVVLPVNDNNDCVGGSFFFFVFVLGLVEA
jgi:hypothetical protein